MTESRFTLTAEELVAFHECLSSKICVNIFQALLDRSPLNISAISRKTGCTNSDAIKHLKNLAKLGIIQEEFYARRHTFALDRTGFTVLMEQAIKAMEATE
jgi:predicted transcriptional regulator